MKKLLLVLIIFTSCKVEKTYIFKPGDTVRVHNTRFLILDYNQSRNGFFYKAKDLNHNLDVEYFSQERLNSVDKLPGQNKPKAQEALAVKKK